MNKQERRVYEKELKGLFIKGKKTMKRSPVEREAMEVFLGEVYEKEERKLMQVNRDSFLQEMFRGM